MKKSTLIIAAFLISLSGSAITLDSIKQDTAWKMGGLLGINFGQASFTNWAAGGQNSVSVGALLTAFANYKKGKSSWDNSLNLAYGMLQVGSSPLQKNQDKIDFTSMYGYRATKAHWYYTVMVNFKSQFANGYNYPNDSVIVSHFMAPGYVIGSIGMDYKTNSNVLSLYLSPLTSKTTIVNDQRLADEGAYGVTPAKYDTLPTTIIKTPGKEVLYQFGAYLKFTFKKDIFKNVNFATNLELFSDYLKDPQNIVVNWQNILTMKVNKYLVANVSTNMIYDNNVPVPVTRTVDGVSVQGTGPRLQFNEVLAIGLSYKF